MDKYIVNAKLEESLQYNGNIMTPLTSSSINFCHIAPTKYLKEYTSTNGAHLILAHLVEQDAAYCEFYKNIEYTYKIMDNSAFEMFKQNRPMYNSAKLISMGDACQADCIVMSDYPKEDWKKTRDAAFDMIRPIRSAGFDAFYVPQSQLGDLDGLIRSIDWALSNDQIRLIGLSILSCPIAMGIDESLSVLDRGDAYKLQRYMSRYSVFKALDDAGILNERALKRFHCLGMMDGPNEIDILKPYHRYIWSWDSSAAVWCGLNGIEFDKSPTGLRRGKFEIEVDFSWDIGYINEHTVNQNINYINGKVRNV